MQLFSRKKKQEPAFRNADTFLSLQDTATEKRFSYPYKKTFDFPSDFIDKEHEGIAKAKLHEWGMIDVGIDGWLLPADALKIYEMAHFSTGDILELGTYRGLSTSIMAKAIQASPKTIYTVDLDETSSNEAKAGLELRDSALAEKVKFFASDATSFVHKMAGQGKKFTFAFVDHSHVYEHVESSTAALRDVLVPGSFVLFHDFNDPRNADEANDDYGVYQGAMDGMKKQPYDFWGIFGCTGLFRFNP